MANSKNSKTATPATEAPAMADAIRPELIAELLKVSGGTAEAEFVVWVQFATLMRKGELSLNGFKAHLAEASAQGAEFATIRPSHAQQSVLMLELSELKGAPRKVSSLYTLADNSVKTAKPAKGQSKSEKALESVAVAKAKGKKFETLQKEVGEAKAEKRDAHHNSKVETLKVDVKTIESLETAITQLDAGKVSPELMSALIGLATAIEVKFA